MYAIYNREVHVLFPSDEEARAYAFGKLEMWFRLTRLEAPDKINYTTQVRQVNSARVRYTSRVTASLAGEEVHAYTLRRPDGKFVVAIPGVDQFAGDFLCQQS